MDTYVFIADTGAIVDSTGHIQLFIKNMKPEKGYLMILPDGTKTATEIVDDLIGTFCDNQFNMLIKSMLSKSWFSPKKFFNLFSVTRLLMNGWNIGGDGNKICLRNNKKTIKFSINTNTKEGIIFDMYVNRELPAQEVSAVGADFRIKVSINKVN